MKAVSLQNSKLWNSQNVFILEQKVTERKKKIFMFETKTNVPLKIENYVFYNFLQKVVAFSFFKGKHLNVNF